MKSLESNFGTIANNVDKGGEYSRISFWFLFVFNIVVLVLGVFILIIAKKRLLTGEGNTFCVKLLLVIFGFLMLILWILVFLMIIGNVATGSVCGVVRDINMGDKKVLNDLTLDALTKKTIEKCFLPDSDGRISDIVNSFTAGTPEYVALTGAIDTMYALFDGVSDYVLWDKNFKKDKVDYSSKLKEELNFYQQGDRFDVPNV